jgi:putative component of membrane protein insertase Oxa1/YidC/SpoIIIJ protein YidD
MANNYRTIQVNGCSYELVVDETQRPFVERLLAGATQADREVDALGVPANPHWLRLIVLALRWYRRVVSLKLGHRCVFDPSCSRYAELAFRHRGVLRGAALTLRRLYLCRPGKSGNHFP